MKRAKSNEDRGAAPTRMVVPPPDDREAREQLGRCSDCRELAENQELEDLFQRADAFSICPELVASDESGLVAFSAADLLNLLCLPEEGEMTAWEALGFNPRGTATYDEGRDFWVDNTSGGDRDRLEWTLEHLLYRELNGLRLVPAPNGVDGERRFAIESCSKGRNPKPCTSEPASRDAKGQGGHR